MSFIRAFVATLTTFNPMLPLFIWLILFMVFVVLLWAAKGVAGQQSKQQANNQMAVRVQHAEKLKFPQDAVTEEAPLDVLVEEPEKGLEEIPKEVEIAKNQDIVSPDLTPVIEEPHNPAPVRRKQKTNRLKWLFAEILD